MSQPTDYTAKLYLQAHGVIPDVLAAVVDIDFVNPAAGCYDLVAGRISDVLTKAGAGCCLEDQLGLAVMMVAELARRHGYLLSRIEQDGAE